MMKESDIDALRRLLDLARTGRVVGIAWVAVMLAGCASSPPTKIGADTYYSSKTNAAGAFGNVGAVAGELMADGNKYCAAMGKEFELVTQTLNQPRPAASLGGASITFRCVDKAGNPVMRPDNGITTIENK